MKRSHIALRFNIESMSRGRPGLYMWTFTLEGVHEPRVGAAMWSRLWSGVIRRLGFRGVRVFELHPGGHGLHVHFLALSYHDVRRVRAAMQSCVCAEGWGTGMGLDVCFISAGRGIHYVEKYVRKAERSGALKGLRLWQRCRIEGSLVRNIAVSSPLSECVRYARFWLRARTTRAGMLLGNPLSHLFALSVFQSNKSLQWHAFKAGRREWCKGGGSLLWASRGGYYGSSLVGAL